jgi:hypothetical protein
MTEDQIARVADDVLRPLLGPLGLENVEVSARQDHDGEPALFISAHYREGSKVPKGTVLLKALGVLHEALRASGEERFPYLDHRFAHDEDFEQEELGDDEPAPQR